MQLVLSALASFALCLLALLALRPLAITLNLIDRPGGHKTHDGEVPVIGGLAMLLGIMLGIGLLPLSGELTGTLVAASTLLVTIGLIDDRFGLSPWLRLPAQVVAAVMLILGAGAAVVTLGDLFGTGEIRLGDAASFVFTALAIVAAINAFNILDGTDGVAGALALVALVALALLAYDGGQAVALATSMVFIGAVGAFLLGNLPIGFNRELRCFMGDSGSTLLGFSVAGLCIVVAQEPAPAARPVTMLWVIALPVYEIFWTVIRRAIRGISPFTPDKGHLHHLVLQAGFGVRGAFVIFLVLAAALASTGILLDRLGLPDAASFSAFVALGVLVVRLFYRADLLWHLVPRPLRRPPVPSSGEGSRR